MANHCATCSHPKRLVAERQYLSGVSIPQIARTLQVSEDSVRGHMREHLSRQLVKAWEIKSITTGVDMLGEIDQIIAKTKAIFDRNFARGRDVTALKALSEQRSTLELLCKISAYMHETKLLEIQQMQDTATEEITQEVQEGLSCLTNAELTMYNKLVHKIANKNTTVIIADKAKDDPFALQHLTRSGKSEVHASYDHAEPRQRTRTRHS